ncbi:nitrite transporter NirC [Sphingobium sp. AP50]|uniref:formate/nitrite transporter family protein n=1 Tax=Sphingobium sp. AP50 TaxID=1884369 RepID=UPI0008B9B63C|nr:formate/nitrite transporter family protein [Sphingobium sp. AP50]SEJ81701.1 nitrite transporter NirC [Sphingobium sp. AP50]
MYEPTITHFAELAREKADALKRSPAGFFIAAACAGAYIGIAMILALSVGSGIPAALRPLVMGSVFGIGLILTVFAGAELFTGYVMYLGFGLARHTVGGYDIARLLVVVWLGNLAGAMALCALFNAGGGGSIFAGTADALHLYASHKVASTTGALFARAVLCNWLVCLAIWTAARVQGDAAKCIVLAWILMAFVASGFEHSVANMTALTLGLLAPGSTIDLFGVGRNLVIVSIGNVAGGLVFIVGSYLAAARTDGPGEPRHDSGTLPNHKRLR